MTDQKNFVVTAWYYVPSFVRWPARAATAEDAIAQIQELKQNHADFWDDQEIDGNGATSTSWECFAETGGKMAAIDTTEIAPGGASRVRAGRP
jgi:hypothetical protein